jgi:hypothetical protein
VIILAIFKIIFHSVDVDPEPRWVHDPLYLSDRRNDAPWHSRFRIKRGRKLRSRVKLNQGEEDLAGLQKKKLNVAKAPKVGRLELQMSKIRGKNMVIKF